MCIIVVWPLHPGQDQVVSILIDYLFFVSSCQWSGAAVQFSSSQWSGAAVQFSSSQWSGAAVQFSSSQWSGAAVQFSSSQWSGAAVQLLFLSVVNLL